MANNAKLLLLAFILISFAPEMQAETFKGTLQLKNISFPYESSQDNINYYQCALVDIASPLDACSPIKSTNIGANYVLIEQGNCTYSTKLNNAEFAGFNMAIVYSKTADEGLLIMTYQSNISIPAVYTSRKAGISIKDQMQNGPVTICVRPKPRRWSLVFLYSLTIGPVVSIRYFSCMCLIY